MDSTAVRTRRGDTPTCDLRHTAGRNGLCRLAAPIRAAVHGHRQQRAADVSWHHAGTVLEGFSLSLHKIPKTVLASIPLQFWYP